MSKKKKIIIILLSTIAVIAAATVLVSVLKNRHKTNQVVNVYQVGEIGYDNYGGSYEYYYGNVISSSNQTVYLTADKKIKEVYVSEGDIVNVGDVLMEYDTTAMSLQLETMRTEVEIAKAQVILAENELARIKKIVPYVPDPTATPTDVPPTDDNLPGGDPGMDGFGDEGFEEQITQAEIDRMIKDKESEIASLKVNVQLVEIDYQIMQLDIANGEVIASKAGIVQTLADEEEAILENKPFIVVSGDEGFTISSQIGELKLGEVSIGDTVSMSYEAGTSYTGIITEISTMPLESGNYSEVSQTFYPMRISIVDENVNLSQGSYVDITIGEGNQQESVFCIPLAFVVKEGSNYYVLVDVNGVLQKKYIKAGPIFWGTEIAVGDSLSREDCLAFPFDKNAREGVKTKVASFYDTMY